jgi:hypothetical protein
VSIAGEATDHGYAYVPIANIWAPATSHKQEIRVLSFFEIFAIRNFVEISTNVSQSKFQFFFKNLKLSDYVMSKITALGHFGGSAVLHHLFMR